ncbi:MAG: hypothetical protein EBZ74_04650 [Planctomycetia bacterium]|nr:hypothetical protein [Planctomycetia bacterium]
MAWSLDFWRRRHRRDVEAERRLLLEDAVPLPACAAVATAAGQTSTRPAETIGPEARVPLGRWDVVPADGRVAEGGGVIDARCVTGVPGARVVRPGDLLEAGSVVLGGAVMLEVARPAAESRMARIAGLLAAATAPQPGRFAPTRAAEEFGERFAAPTLATAGLGLLAGDVATAVAIMRPDYANGEALAVSFEDLDAVARGLAAGCVLARPAALDALDTVDTILLVDHPRLRDRGTRVTRVVAGVAAGDEPQAESIRWAASLARHLADPRREALGALAAERGSVLVDIVPQSFGDAAGLRLVHGVGGRDVCLGEARTEQAAEWRPLVLEVAGRPAATFEFGPAPERAATRALDRLREIRGDRELRVLLAVDTAAARDTGTAETLAHELHCDGVVDVAGIGLAGQVRTLTQAGRRVACVGPAAAVAAAEDVATVTVGLGDEPPAAGIVALSGDVGCLADLCRAAGERRARLLLSRRLTILPNVACVAGAFLLGFTSLVAAVVTNLGTLGTYRRAAATLHHDRRRHWLRHRSISQGRPPWRAS